jgi:hypothetical protein
MAKVPTIAIVYPANRRGGYVVINKSDFDPAVHQVYDPNAPRPEPSPVVAVNPVTPGPAADTAAVVPEPALLSDPVPAPAVVAEPVAPPRKRGK